MELDNIPFDSVSPCEYADALPRHQFMDYAIKPLWEGIPRIAGPAFTVKCEPGDHLMLHAAIYRASPGDIIVVEADDKFAVAGGNVCAIAQARGIKCYYVSHTGNLCLCNGIPRRCQCGARSCLLVPQGGTLGVPDQRTRRTTSPEND